MFELPVDPGFRPRHRELMLALRGGEPSGVQLRTTRVCVKAREVFTAGELEARIVAHAERVLREEVVSPDDAKRRQTGREGNGRRKSC